ncbi:Predicted DNA-binding transcriptional regulator YafY, contains an HTH and WYL domains [Lentzea waywayandensis]|uniref:Predicted DNA-binding transcriptional regulator YafY, contains an HTH and WYL domains n=1 Tax=Lentzea waywayandensis TaxID=84724 RepID=A0A1I6DDK3_9PSEU|nr:YafY family protein [Lentzea waywayandensis]SFR03524.1 Predicted DNA-binding transcriptional regulator YafY, contains an HTH and WYL domains [Lentzea waywayandensis]
MKSDRLLSILLLLQTHGQLSAAALAGRLEVSARTIMRDVEALSTAGVPVYTVRGPQGGIALLPGYHTDVTGLTADESRALFVVLAGSAHTDLGLGHALGSALRKVMAALPAPHRDDADLTSRRVLIDPVRWRGSPGRSTEDLEVFQRAVFADRRLRLRYRHGRDNRVRTYTVDPYGLVSKAGVWYLVADHQGDPNLYRVDRAQSATVLGEPVQRRDGVELDDAWEALRRRIDDLPTLVAVTALVKDDVLALFLRVHQGDLADPSSPPVPREPGWSQVELRFRSVRAVETLLAFGPGVEVLAPDEARQALAGQARAIADLYEAPPRFLR